MGGGGEGGVEKMDIEGWVVVLDNGGSMPAG